MGKRGPKKEPTKLKILKGNPGKKPLNKSEPKPKVLKEDEPPKEFKLNARAKKIYKRVYAVLADIDLATEADVYTLARYAQELDEYLLCCEFLEKKRKEALKSGRSSYGEEGLSKNGSVFFSQYPEVAVRKQLEDSLKKLECEFGFTPSARTTLSVPLRDKDKSKIKNKIFGT